MWKQKKSLKEIQEFVLSKREVGPNCAFINQLKLFETAIKLPLDDERVNQIHPIDEIGLRISLLPQIIRFRVSRLSTEKWGNKKLIIVIVII